ncbi:Carboxylesterase type B [Penicillium cf. viridicatum]|uniref:Carboxylic ester hydrolase n=1 Tax=Penicillium cf. viridicatum TaxID=2972119 RepID=A0A9W9T4M9_9EURO|nr:Carboxylesterase type B [Penicillium cf. viridicatum]
MVAIQRIIILIAGLFGGLMLASPSHSWSRSPVIDLEYSQHRGISLSNGVDQYLGMRYAKAPLGNLRFRGPENPEDTVGVSDASSFGPLCVGVGESINDSLAEDCLFINVWRPTNASADSNLPVWLFIQGGGYANNANGNYNGSEVVQQSGHNIIFVNFNYRVGVLGFLASEHVRKNGDLNAGLLDQRKALHWVQKHIRKFGGNPDHVVVHGDSSGAGSVAYHLTAYGQRNTTLFIGAVAESPFWPTKRTVAQMEFQYDRFVKDVSCHKAKDSLACLRSVDIKIIQKFNVDNPFPGGSPTPVPRWYFLPVVDGDLIRDHLYNLFSEGKFIHVPLLVGDETNEGTDFAYNASSKSEVAQFMKNNYPGLSHNQLDTINKAYEHVDPLPKHAAYFASAAGAYGDSTFTCPGNFMTAAMAKSSSSHRVWNYRYNIRDTTKIANGMGVSHVFDLPAIFGIGETNQPTYSYASSNAKIVPITMNYYLSFIKVLDPNIYRYKDAPEWQPWGSGSGQRLRLETNSTEMEAIPSLESERCSMWKDFAADMQH